MSVASKFTSQDVLYGRTTKKAIRQCYPQKENGNFLDYWTFGELTSQELEERIAYEASQYYPDDEGNLFFTEDLLNKHLAYKISNKEKR